MHFNLRLGMVFVIEKNLAKVVAAAESLSQVDQAPAQQWQSLVGTLQAQVTLVPLCQLKLCPIQFHLHSSWSQLQDPPGQAVPVTPRIRELLQWWSARSNLTQGVFATRCFRDTFQHQVSSVCVTHS